MNIGTCGLVNILSIRRLDTGSIRVKNGSTLVLTGVLSDTNSKKNELIILVTPNIINEKFQYKPENLEKYNFK